MKHISKKFWLNMCFRVLETWIQKRIELKTIQCINGLPFILGDVFKVAVLELDSIDTNSPHTVTDEFAIEILSKEIKSCQ